MTFDPQSNAVSITQMGPKAFDETNRVNSGQNGGWVQIMGPINSVVEQRR